MSIKHQEPSVAGTGQSPGCDPKTSKRSSGLFSFFRWFKPSVSRESVTQEPSPSSSCDSLNSITSTGTIASFSFVPPSDYKTSVTAKNIVPGPETDTYKARLKQRDKRREHDKDLTLRKKYNLFFNRDTILKTIEVCDNSKSLPLMTRKTADQDEEKSHRRTNSESSKIKRAGAYCHVKGKRKAPQPPANKTASEGTSTMSLRRKKRLAPQPPNFITPQKILSSLDIEYADADIIFNDSLKLDHGILKSAKETAEAPVENGKSPRSSYVEAPVSPRPWYKRSSNASSKKSDEPEVHYLRNSNVPETSNKKKDDKRKSGIAFLTNISELDREASEIVKKEHQNDDNEMEPPPFMRPKQEQIIKNNTDSWVTPKRRSARDLIAKFNAITNVTKVTVNSAFFGVKESGAFQKDNFKRDYFGKPASISEEPSKQINTENQLQQTKNTNGTDVKIKIPLAKSESAVSIKIKEIAKPEKKSWYCPKCSLENDYWRIICSVCSTIKPYFDDLTTPPAKNNTLEKKKIQNFSSSVSSDPAKNTSQVKIAFDPQLNERPLERSKTQIGFSALAKYNESHNDKNKKFLKSSSVEEKSKRAITDKQEERERLKKMLIEMKNSLPKRKHNPREKVNDPPPEEAVDNVDDENKTIEIVTATKQTLYENIKVKKTENPKPIKVTAAAQTNAFSQKPVVVSGLFGAPQKSETEKTFELLRPKDFADIYNAKTENAAQHMYANLIENDADGAPLDVPEIKNNLPANNNNNNTDTLEINRLLKRLETAISRGERSEASNLARELAQLKVNCSVVRQKSDDKRKPGFTVNLYVEDKVSHRGPFPIRVLEEQTVAELKMQVENEFQIPAAVQRWILGKELATDDNATLKDLHVNADGCSIFLYLVTPANDQKVVLAEPEEPVTPTTSNADAATDEDYDSNTLKPHSKTWECIMCTFLNSQTNNVCAICATIRKIAPVASTSCDAHYLQLLNLDNADLVENVEAFECLVCLNNIAPRDGVTLRECLHQFCKACLAYTIEFTDEAEVKCPYRDNNYSCDISLQDREVKALVTPEMYDQFLAKSVAQAENKSDKSFHCKTPDCKGWCIFEDNVNEFHCPVCQKTNCLTCQAIHVGLNCKEYQEKMNETVTDDDTKRTKEMLEEMVNKGEAIKCPTCAVILMKKWGCDWLRCSMCKTEICWVTRGPRWGPAGKGDVSGGCQCGVNGVKCHPQCNYCH